MILRHTPGPAARAARPGGPVPHRASCSTTEAGLAATLASVAARARPQTYIGSRRPPRLARVLPHRPRGQRRRAVLGPQPRPVAARRPTAGSRWTRCGSTRTRSCGEHLTEQAAEQPAAGQAVVGHVHLQVGDVPSARGLLRRRARLRRHGRVARRALRLRGRLPPPPRDEHLEQRRCRSARVVARSRRGRASSSRRADDLGALADRVAVRSACRSRTTARRCGSRTRGRTS